MEGRYKYSTVHLIEVPKEETGHDEINKEILEENFPGLKEMCLF